MQDLQRNRLSMPPGHDTISTAALIDDLHSNEKKLKMEIKLNKLLRQNILLSQQNRALEGILATSSNDENTAASAFLSSDFHATAFASKISPDSDPVPPTVMAPPPSPPADFNGARAVLAHLPADFSHEPAVGSGAVDTDGSETRGSLTLERLQRRGLHARGRRPGTYLRVAGRRGHHLDCTLRGFRVLSGEYTGATVSTGAPAAAAKPPPRSHPHPSGAGGAVRFHRQRRSI
jgi:hypothetical protein